MAAIETLPLDPYIVDTLMADLVGHDHRPAAFVVYLHLWRRTCGIGRARTQASHQAIAAETGLSRSSVQAAIRHLKWRQLIAARRDSATAVPVYEVRTPWRRDLKASIPAR